MASARNLRTCRLSGFFTAPTMRRPIGRSCSNALKQPSILGNSRHLRFNPPDPHRLLQRPRLRQRLDLHHLHHPHAASSRHRTLEFAHAASLLHPPLPIPPLTHRQPAPSRSHTLPSSHPR